MGYTKSEWELTDQEIAYIDEAGGDIEEAQEAKKEAYIEAGGVILNPDALEDLYEACKEMMERFNRGTRFPLQSTCDKMNGAIARVEGG